MENVKPVIAVFDFDNTLTRKDTLVPFLHSIAGSSKTILNIAIELPSLASVLMGFKTRQQGKEGVLTRFLKGMPKNDITKFGEEFAKSSVDPLLNPKAMNRLLWHQEQWHRCILISATLDIYLEPWSQHHGFQNLICSQLEFDSRNIATGRLVGLNCWGPEKARRLLLLLGPRESFTLYAYGDSKGDKELLDMADYPFYRKFKIS